MEDGFPGDLSLEVRYSLNDDNALEIGYKAVTDAPTVLNLTNHCYFNLNGHDGSDVLGHRLWLNSSFFTELDEAHTPTGRILPVDNTPLDLREGKTIGARINDDHEQLKNCRGYDHNMVLDGKTGDFKPVGTAKSDRTGICLSAFTTEPAIQPYTGNYLSLDAVSHGKNEVIYPDYGGFCLEAQHYPDSVNHPSFPSVVLRPGEAYFQRTVYRFGIG